MSAEGGTRAILAALGANLGIAVAKFVGFVITGSSSMLAEGAHSVADSANQGLLLFGGRRARRAATVEHPFGYGRDRYFYAFIVALVLFTLGSLFSLYEGFHKVRDHEATLDRPQVAIVILLVALGLESFSLRTAVVESNEVRGESSWFQFIRRAKAPELPVVLLEDTAALVGLVFALAGVGLSWATGDTVWDGVATVFIGLLLG
ncbi:MAG TPA: cation transporter, partial [Mycobacteriales bacterium]|nr:cation transporter [Mycobacteriales bacterium]